ncbi:hypothetical protein ACA910_011082 [Epithemia clementina (nom. ined.)]
MLESYESNQTRLHASGAGSATPNASVGASINTIIPSGSRDTATSTTTSSSTRNTSAERIRFRMEWPLSSAVVPSTVSVLQLCRGLWVGATEILAASHMSTRVIHIISILLIVAEFLVRLLQEYIEDAIKLPKAPLEVQVIWLAPLFTAIASYSLFLSLLVQLQPSSNAVVLAGVISLAMMECLVPVTLTGCSALFWFDMFSAETALLVLFVVWVAAAKKASDFDFAVSEWILFY